MISSPINTTMKLRVVCHPVISFYFENYEYGDDEGLIPYQGFILSNRNIYNGKKPSGHITIYICLKRNQKSVGVRLVSS